MKVFYRHYRVFRRTAMLPFGGVTTYVELTKTPHGQLVATGGMAVCSLADNYCKRLGRLIAQGRAEHGVREGCRFYVQADSFEQLERRLNAKAFGRFYDTQKKRHAPQIYSVTLQRVPAKKPTRKGTEDGQRA
jgi:hypothetical protein